MDHQINANKIERQHVFKPKMQRLPGGNTFPFVAVPPPPIIPMPRHHSPPLATRAGPKLPSYMENSQKMGESLFHRSKTNGPR
jgi:hypothetical protein